MSQDPKTPEEWQEAVDAAEGALVLDSARQYGLVTGGPEINIARCCEILERGKGFGIEPSQGAVERFIHSLAGAIKRKGKRR